ncbi:MAG: hypothetical protein ACYDB7_01835 [Mycobacteriales bacterium]
MTEIRYLAGRWTRLLAVSVAIVTLVAGGAVASHQTSTAKLKLNSATAANAATAKSGATRAASGAAKVKAKPQTKPQAKPRAKPKPPAARPAPVKPVCDLVTGTPGSESSNYPGVPGDPALNILSADVATNATTLTWVIRVAHLTAASADTDAPTGREWSFNFYVNGSQYGLTAFSNVLTGTSGNQGATVTLDIPHNEVFYSIPLKSLPTSIGLTIVPGVTELIGMYAQAGMNVFSQPVGDSEDQAVHDTAPYYLAGTPSCLPVGSS